MPRRLRVDWITCEGRGLCIEMLHELVDPDDWGYPIIDEAPVPAPLDERARRTVAACPTLALRLDDA